LDEDRVIHSRVGGIDVTLSTDDIAHVLTLPSKGFDIFSDHLNSFDLYSEEETRESASGFYIIMVTHVSPGMTKSPFSRFLLKS